MAEERNLTKTTQETSAVETADTDTTKEELHQRMEQARDSISQTVAEIKDTVTSKVDKISGDISRTLDWREHVSKNPLAFSLGALAVGFATGAMVLGGGETKRHYSRKLYASNEAPGADGIYESTGVSKPRRIKKEKEGPGLYDKLKETDAFQRLQSEVTKIGDQLVDEIVSVGKDVLLPAVVVKAREMVAEIIPTETSGSSARKSSSSKAALKSDSANKTNSVSDTDEDALSQSKTNALS